ncbi:MAG: hypothetical protein JNM88_00650 [Chitinophagaceae bacterium]|nr:hypothetical protein [Chitinophagaceae bacterium]
MSDHLAITIGPIYKFMQEAKKTRELWSISFTFSRLMKHLIDTFSEKAKLLAPDKNVEQPMHGAGVFPDRCYFELPAGLLTENEIGQLKEHAFAAFSNETGIRNGITAYQVNIVQTSADSNPVSRLNSLLDALELQQPHHPASMMNWSEYWMPPAYGRFFSGLYDIAYAKEDILPVLVAAKSALINRFPSIPEISTNELARKYPERYWDILGYQVLDTDRKNGLYFSKLEAKKQREPLDEDDPIIQAIKDGFKDEFLTRHKYFSVVQADGDNVGRLISEIERSGGKLTNLSAALNSFAKKAAELLVIYGGFPVYIGGDDLLFFAPLADNTVQDRFSVSVPELDGAWGNVWGTNLFFLLTRLNELFKAVLKPETDKYPGLPAVSLSFGVMSGYYKQPLSEVQKASFELLKYKAKKQPGKNHIAMKVEKHSGETFRLNFCQSEPLYACFLHLCHSVENKELKFLNSVMYKLDDQKEILALIGAKKARLEIFFRENFNEAGHDQHKQFFQWLTEFIVTLFKNYPALSIEEKVEKIYSALRFVHFINAKDVND